MSRMLRHLIANGIASCFPCSCTAIDPKFSNSDARSETQGVIHPKVMPPAREGTGEVIAASYEVVNRTGDEIDDVDFLYAPAEDSRTREKH